MIPTLCRSALSRDATSLSTTSFRSLDLVNSACRLTGRDTLATVDEAAQGVPKRGRRVIDQSIALLPATATVVGLVALTQIPNLLEGVGIAAVVLAVALRSREGDTPEPLR